MLSLRQVSLDVARYRWYGARNWSSLLQDISFDVAPGQMVALVGGSGEGKSLLLQCLLDLLPDNLRFNGSITPKGKRWIVMIFANVVAILSAMSRKVFRRLTRCSRLKSICAGQVSSLASPNAGKLNDCSSVANWKVAY